MLISLRKLTLGLVAALTLSGSAVMASHPNLAASEEPSSAYSDSDALASPMGNQGPSAQYLGGSNPMGANSMPSAAPQAYRMVVGGSYSQALGAEFRVENFFLPAFGQFTGVRLVSAPNFNSPLRNLGLQAGDVITRLDGVRVNNLAELENHYSWTEVRYIKTGSQTVRFGNIFINNNVGPQPVPSPVIDNAP